MSPTPFAGKLELDFRPKPRSEQYSFSEAAERDKDESEKKRDEKRTRMDEDLAGLDPITVEKSYPGLYSFRKCDQGLSY